jgi:hypothetical protein
MKVYFTYSTTQFRKFRDTYFKIRSILIRNRHILTRDWLPATEDRLIKEETELSDIQEIYKGCIEAIKESDLVIVEDTVSNFSTGHQITKALQMRKPTLVLWQGQKYREFNQMFIQGIESDILEIDEYDSNNLEKVIRVFINKYKSISKKNRFHLVLDNLERSYLDWAQHKYSRSRTKLLKDALRRKIDSDVQYKDYLSKK